MIDANTVRNILLNGSLKEVLGLKCPECGRLLEIQYSSGSGGSYAVNCECFKFGLRGDGVPEPEWVKDVDRSMRVYDIESKYEFRVTIEHGEIIKEG
ncbi:hypothetical protein [Leptonema illini]|uniref:hypothetical protein n=1 Tax=Leptonema illini TaxID=183 RepID=UPI00117A10F0|nr:hypothetical protein [Leptonema illini]